MIFNKRGDKRGISDVITTVLMILLVIAAIGVIYVVIRGFVNRGMSTTSLTFDCMNVELTPITAYINSTPVDPNNNECIFTAQVSRTGGDPSTNLTDFAFY
ncbi:MAG: archaellin/type IV pilin N-terminal domain-containing protein, partial [Candidatus Pacearchaeota archaeon]